MMMNMMKYNYEYTNVHYLQNKVRPLMLDDGRSEGCNMMHYYFTTGGNYFTTDEIVGNFPVFHIDCSGNNNNSLQ